MVSLDSQDLIGRLFSVFAISDEVQYPEGCAASEGHSSSGGGLFPLSVQAFAEKCLSCFNLANTVPDEQQSHTHTVSPAPQHGAPPPHHHSSPYPPGFNSPVRPPCTHPLPSTTSRKLYDSPQSSTGQMKYMLHRASIADESTSLMKKIAQIKKREKVVKKKYQATAGFIGIPKEEAKIKFNRPTWDRRSSEEVKTDKMKAVKQLRKLERLETTLAQRKQDYEDAMVHTRLEHEVAIFRTHHATPERKKPTLRPPRSQ